MHLSEVPGILSEPFSECHISRIYGGGGVNTVLFGKNASWWTFRIFFIFFLLGGGEGGSRRRKGGEGGRVFIENPRRGDQPGEGRGNRGAGRVSVGNWGGGAKYFFSGPKFPPRRFPCFYRFFFSHRGQQTLSLERVKTGIFSVFGCHQVSAKTRVWNSVPRC